MAVPPAEKEINPNRFGEKNRQVVRGLLSLRNAITLGPVKAVEILQKLLDKTVKP